MTYDQIFKRISEELSIPIEVVKLAYDSYWEFIRQNIQELPLKEDLTEEEFNKLNTNFNIPSLGKLVCTYERNLGVKEKYRYIERIKHDKS